MKSIAFNNVLYNISDKDFKLIEDKYKEVNNSVAYVQEYFKKEDELYIPLEKLTSDRKPKAEISIIINRE